MFNFRESKRKVSKFKVPIINIFQFRFCFIPGDYLGEKNDFNEQVLKAFVELHDFTNLILVQALR